MRFLNIFRLQFLAALIFLNNYSNVGAKNVHKRSVMDNFNDGLKFAGQMFGINTAADVANLVAKAFSATPKHQKTAESPEPVASTSKESNEKSDEQQWNDATETRLPDRSTAHFLSGILKMIGFDARKLGALAINALILVAQAIGNTLMTTKSKRRRSGDGDHSSSSDEAENADDDDSRKLRRVATEGNPIDWFLENRSSEMRALLGDITDEKLSVKLTNMIEKLETKRGDGDCIKMLMCKSAPFIKGMQKSLAKRLANGTVSGESDAQSDGEEFFMNTKGFFIHLPTIKEFREHGAECEEHYAKNCNTTIF